MPRLRAHPQPHQLRPVRIAAAVIAYQCADTIVEMLDSLVGQVSDVVICIDPKTDDDAREVVSEWEQGQDERAPAVHLSEGLDANEAGYDAARNNAFAKAWELDPEWVMWIDTDDVYGTDVPLPEFLARLP